MQKTSIHNISGIDYGSKMAGTSVICFLESNKLVLQQSLKGKNADKFILDAIKGKELSQIFIDAPLSLPAAYYDKGSDYFYRECDRQLKAMSPMFLGGLTARAMKLVGELKGRNIQSNEVYPAGLVNELNLHLHYKKDLDSFRLDLAKYVSYDIPQLENWHQADSVLAWTCGMRFINNDHIEYGSRTEGTIII